MEEMLNRKLNRNEIVHHKDENRQNNNINNLEIVSSKEHSLRHTEPQLRLTCYKCKKVFFRSRSKAIGNNQKTNFCSSWCHRHRNKI